MREFFLGKLSHRISVQNLETNNNCQDASFPRMRSFLNQSLRANSFYSFFAIAHNELGYTTLSVAESRRDVSVGATSCNARSVTEDNVPLGRARARVPSGACQPQLVAVV